LVIRLLRNSFGDPPPLGKKESKRHAKALSTAIWSDLEVLHPKL
jgi:hypothetical protein